MFNFIKNYFQLDLGKNIHFHYITLVILMKQNIHIQSNSWDKVGGLEMGKFATPVMLSLSQI